MKSMFSIACALLLLLSCKDKPVVIGEKQVDPVIDSSKIRKEREFSKLELLKIYELDSVAPTDTLLPRVPEDGVKKFLLTYGEKHPEKLVRMKTEYGDVLIELSDRTPLERASFVMLVKNHYFDGTVAHRVVPRFVMQAGNSDATVVAMKRAMSGSYLLPPNFNTGLKHNRGAVSLARLWDDNPEKLHNPYEFFITLGNADHLNGEHTVFGKVVSGIEVADRIASVPRDSRDWPLKDVPITFEIVE